MLLFNNENVDDLSIHRLIELQANCTGSTFPIEMAHIRRHDSHTLKRTKEPRPADDARKWIERKKNRVDKSRTQKICS